MPGVGGKCIVVAEVGLRTNGDITLQTLKLKGQMHATLLSKDMHSCNSTSKIISVIRLVR